MMVSLYNGVSGIKTNGFGLDVSANNIANVNTVGFKNSQAEFKDVFYQANVVGGQNPVGSSVGLATTVGATALDMRGGSYQHTDNPFDLAIEGDGFFAVSGSKGFNGDNAFYTRAGQFMLDVDRNLVSSSGYYLLGTSASVSDSTYSQAMSQKLGPDAPPAKTLELTSDLDIANTQSSINLPTSLYIPPEPTTQVDFKGYLAAEPQYGYAQLELNLDNKEFNIEENKAFFKANIADTPEFAHYYPGDTVVVSFANEAGKVARSNARVNEDGTFEVNGFDLSSLANEEGELGQISVSATALSRVEQPSKAKFVSGLYSSSGYENTLTINLTKQTPTPEQGGANWDMVATITDKDGNEISQATGVLSFNGYGALSGSTLGALDNEGAAVSVGFGSLYEEGVPNSGFDGVVMRGASSGLTDQERNGHKDGMLRSYAMSEDGTILAEFDNGLQAAIARVPVFHFQNDQGLFSEGGVLFSKSANSGEPFLYEKEGKAYNGSRIASHMLEASNVDLANEMTMLIVQQRAYEASARSVTTSDQMLQRAINMKN